MRAWSFPVTLDPHAGAPLFAQIARAVSDDVRRGRLRAGDALPGSRTLAATLGVHRNTVLAAYAELASQGWVTARPAGATVISAEMPEPRPRRFTTSAPSPAAIPERPGFHVPSRAPFPPTDLPRGVVHLAGGFPDPRLVPAELIARAYRRAARGAGKKLFNYDPDPQGLPRLREALAGLLRETRGVPASSANVTVTAGSQMGIYLAARTLVQPGDAVAVEDLGYQPAWGALSRAGARVLPVPVDAHGIDVGALAALCAREKLRAVYVTPHHQYPTTAVLSPARRAALLDLAARERFAVIEDDYDHEFHYDGRPIAPLASADGRGVVVYIGTLSKVLAPGLRMGYVVAPAELAFTLGRERWLIDRQGDRVAESAVAELIEDGELARHVRRVARVYRARRDALAEGLTRELGDAVSFVLPAGGLAIWARAARGLDVEAWSERALVRGFALRTERTYHLLGRMGPGARLGFSALDEREIAAAVRGLAAALPVRRGGTVAAREPRH